MKNNFLFLILVLATATGSGALAAYLMRHDNKIAYIKADVLFSDFEMTRELKVNYDNTINARQEILDSLIAILRVTPKSELTAGIEKEYYFKKDLFEEQNSELTRKLDSQVQLRINQYMMEYGRKNGYDFILGANGNGSIMYADDAQDITTEVLSFMNGSYKGTLK